MPHNATGRIIAVACLVTCAADTNAATYDIELLPEIGEPGGSAFAIDEEGRVAGSSFTEFVPCGDGLLCSYVHAVLWSDGVVTDLHDFPNADISTALGMSESGVVVGQVLPYLSSEWEAWIRDGAGTTILPSLTGLDTLAMDVNDRGQVAGWSDDSQGHHQAVLWQDGVLVELGTYKGGTESYAEGMNEEGAIVGAATTDGDLRYTRRATLWEDGQMVMVDTRVIEVPQSVAHAINDRRQIVGRAWDVDRNGNQARLWEEDPKTGAWVMTDLGSTAEQGRTIAWDVNNHGQIVGEDNRDGAFLWEDGVIHDLNELIPPGSGWTLVVARGINDAGQIVGLGWAPNGAGQRAFLLTPAACIADLDGSGAVDFGDILAILSAWGNAGGPEDLDESGTVDFGDLLVVLGSWGPCLTGPRSF